MDKPLKGIAIYVSFKDGIFDTSKHVNLFFGTLHPQKISDTIEGAMKEIKKHKGWRESAYIAVEAIEEGYGQHRYKVFKPYIQEKEISVYTRQIGASHGSDETLTFDSELKMYKALKQELDKAVKDLLCGQKIEYSDIYV